MLAERSMIERERRKLYIREQSVVESSFELFKVGGVVTFATWIRNVLIYEGNRRLFPATRNKKGENNR